MAVRALLAGFLCGLSACSLSIDFGGTRFACDPPDGACPEGYVCAPSGFCELPDGPPDADVTAVDASTVDAPPGTPDAGFDAAVPAVTATFGERDTSMFRGVTADTQLDLANPDFNYGGSIEFNCDSNTLITGLVRFDLDSIPPGATVLSATLELWTGTDPLSDGTIELHRVLEDWREGNQDGATGDSSWNQRQPGVDWDVAGAYPPLSSTAGIEASLATSAADTPYSFALSPALVQGWVDAPASNNGLACIVSSGVDADSDFKSSESAFHERRPQLTIVYQP
jgi:hypothetical protein